MRADCADHRCPGVAIALEMRNGGENVDTNAPPVTPDQMSGWTLYLIAIFCAVALAAAWLPLLTS
jgi:hypothetical protein